MGACLTSACISLAIPRLTRSIWRSLQGSPLLPGSSLAQFSMVQLDLVATDCSQPLSQSRPCLDPIRTPTIMSALIWTCHTSSDTYPRHAVTFCPNGVKKHSGGFLLLLYSPTLPVVLFFPFSLLLPVFFFFSHALSRLIPLLCWLLLLHFSSLKGVNPPAFPSLPFVILTHVWRVRVHSGFSHAQQLQTGI